MRVSAVLTQTGDSWSAECEEIDRAGEGPTPQEAIESLRQALKEYFCVEAVAPPSDVVADAIEIVILDAPSGVALETDVKR